MDITECGKCGAGRGSLDRTDPQVGVKCICCGWCSGIEQVKAEAAHRMPREAPRPSRVRLTDVIGTVNLRKRPNRKKAHAPVVKGHWRNYKEKL